MIPWKPGTLRIFGGVCYAIAALAFASVALGLVLTIRGDGPSWNNADRFGSACGWMYIGLLHFALAATRDEDER